MSQSYQFPKNFVWGVAAASAQIEGAISEDGKGESIWDRFCAQTGNVIDGTGTQPACDHYHRYAQDIALMQELGVKNYRLSIAWPRIFPHGIGAPNLAGFGFLRPRYRYVSRRRNHAVGHVVSLGFAASVGRSKRLAQPRHRARLSKATRKRSSSVIATA